MEQFREFEVENQRIAATVHIPEETPAPGVVMCHGFTGHRIEAHFLFVKAARELCSAGLNVLRFDFRGSGESAGLFRDMTISAEIADALAALDILREEPTVDEDSVALIGLSLGGLVAACTAARDGAVAALVLWSAVADMVELVKERWQMPTDPGRLDVRGHYEHGAHQVGVGFLLDALRIKPLKEIADYTGPALVVHGTEDEAVPTGHARMYVDAMEAGTLRIVEGADHTYGTVAFEREVIEATRDWLLDQL